MEVLWILLGHVIVPIHSRLYLKRLQMLKGSITLFKIQKTDSVDRGIELKIHGGPMGKIFFKQMSKSHFCVMIQILHITALSSYITILFLGLLHTRMQRGKGVFHARFKKHCLCNVQWMSEYS